MVGVGDRPAPGAGPQDGPGVPVWPAGAGEAEAGGAGPFRAVRGVLPAEVRGRRAPVGDDAVRGGPGTGLRGGLPVVHAGAADAGAAAVVRGVRGGGDAGRVRGDRSPGG